MSCPPLCPPEKNRFPWLFVAVSGRLARTELRPLLELTIPVSPQVAGPAVPEREIGPGTGSGVLWHARGLEIAACPAKLKDSGGRTPSNAMAASMSSWRWTVSQSAPAMACRRAATCVVPATRSRVLQAWTMRWVRSRCCWSQASATKDLRFATRTACLSTRRTRTPGLRIDIRLICPPTSWRAQWIPFQ